MKKKTKKKKPASKTLIKRPAHKKPRPKKHVEAKIPQLPPVPTQVIEAQAAPLCIVHPEATKTPCLDCMKATEGSVDLHMWEEPGWDKVREACTETIKPKKQGLLARLFGVLFSR